MGISQKTRVILTGIAIVVIGVIGWLWYQDSHRGPEPTPAPPQTVVDTVDRGISEADMAREEQQIADVQAQIAAADQEGKPRYDLMLQLGNLYYTIGELKLSVEQYDRILAALPKDAPSLENKGQAQLERGDYTGALASWQAAVAVAPYELTYIRLANLIAEHFPDRQAEIQPLLEDAIATLGQSPGLLERLGQWYADNGMLDEAISHYEVASKLDPKDETLRDEIDRLKAQRVLQESQDDSRP